MSPRQLIVDAETSLRMAGVAQKDTTPERIVRGIMHQLGHRYRVRNRDLPGSPDLANRKRKWAIFVHGCFWHHHPGCGRATVPKRNREYWLEKFDQNKRRDARVSRALGRLGYRVFTVWECQTRDSEKLRRSMMSRFR